MLEKRKKQVTVYCIGMFACFNFLLRCQALTGGISNHLFAYYKEDRFDDDVVIFRIEGEGNELMLDRKEERKHMQVTNDDCSELP